MSGKCERTDPLQHVDQETVNDDVFIITEDYDDEALSERPIELYFCAGCGYDFDSIEAYTTAHSGAPGTCDGGKGVESEIEVIDETELVDDETLMEPTMVENDSAEQTEIVMEKPLWELVDVEPAIRMSAEQETIASEKYFCYDCHFVFEDRLSAEEHACPQEESSASSSVNADQTDIVSKPLSKRMQRKVATSGDVAATFICDICNTIFGSAKSLKFHMRIHDKRVTKSIQDALPVGAHQQYSELDQFHCEICNKSFDQNLLSVHKQMHQGRTQHVCGICNRKFDNVTNYMIHLKIHDKGKEPFPAPGPTQNKPVRPGSTDKDKPGFPCQYCERVFSRPYEKVKHERVHTGEKPYSCEVCGKMFRVSYSLTLHLRSHTNIRPYVCTTCNKRFKSHQVYSHHLRTHRTECEYACDICHKAFRTSVQLYAHKNTHTKPFQCAVCNRPFSSLYAVKTHMLSHKKDQNQGEKSSSSTSSKFWCTMCGAEYARPFALRHHMKTAHNEMTQLNKDIAVDDDDHIEDTETAVLIAAAEADAAYINAAANDVDVVMGVVPTYDQSVEVSADAFDVKDFHSEEIITDWLK